MKNISIVGLGYVGLSNAILLSQRNNVIAVDTDIIPMHSIVYIEGAWEYEGLYIAKDTGGAIKGNKIDLCFEKSNSELMAFGRKTMTVYILE